MRSCLTLLLTIFSLALFASTDTVKVKSKIAKATVFFNGAEVSRSVSVNLSTGKHWLVLEHLSHEIDPQSIQVKSVAFADILSVKHGVDINNSKTLKAKKEALEDKADKMNVEIQKVKNKIAAFHQEEEIILANRHLGKNGEVKEVEAIKAAADFYRLRLNEINEKKLELELSFEKFVDEIKDINKKLNTVMNELNKMYSKIYLLIDCKRTINKPLELSYYVPSAGWSPLYDFRVKEIDEPLSITYNANVYQSTGEDWENTKVTLSSSDPSLSSNLPELDTWFLGRGATSKNIPNKRYGGPATLEGRVYDNATNEPLPFVNVVLMDGEKMVNGASTDFDGFYTIKPVPAGYYTLRCTYVGYNPINISGVRLQEGNITTQNLALVGGVDLEEVVVQYQMPMVDADQTSSGGVIEMNRMPSRSVNSIASTVAGVSSRGSDGSVNIRGSRSGGEFVYIDGIKVRGSQNLPKSAIVEKAYFDEDELKMNLKNLAYEIKEPYTIKSDGQDNLIKIKQASKEVRYVFHAIPKMDLDVFLMAELTDWSELQLLSGPISIYFEGTFTGSSYVDVENLSDTLDISLGRDREILVARKGNKEINDKRFVGNNIKQRVGWEIEVRNNKKAPIEIIVEDQFPISELSSTSVERSEVEGAKVDEKTGAIQWELKLEPQEKKVLKFDYTVKYPKYSSQSFY